MNWLARGIKEARIAKRECFFEATVRVVGGTGPTVCREYAFVHLLRLIKPSYMTSSCPYEPPSEVALSISLNIITIL